MVEVRLIACASCGAPISVPESVKFVTCGHCGSLLQITTTDGAVYSELREALDSVKDAATKSATASERVANELELRRLQDDLREASTRMRAALVEQEEMHRATEARIAKLQEDYNRRRECQKREFFAASLTYKATVIFSPFLFLGAAMFLWLAFIFASSPITQPSGTLVALSLLGAALISAGITVAIIWHLRSRMESARWRDSSDALEERIRSLRVKPAQFLESSVKPLQQHLQALQDRIEDLRRVLHSSGRLPSVSGATSRVPRGRLISPPAP